MIKTAVQVGTAALLLSSSSRICGAAGDEVRSEQGGFILNAPRLVLYGHFGGGNLGNDSSLEAAIHNIRKYHPSAKITVVCSGPQLIAERFRVETLPISAYHSDTGHQITNRVSHKIKRVTTRIVDQIDFWLRRTWWFRTIDQFIVVGTGAVDDMADRPWNGPYDLFRWCSAAKLAGARVGFLSVGVGPIEDRFSRALMLRALRAADYRSYRDIVSIEYLNSVGFDTSRDSMYPDLVFSLPEKYSICPHSSSPLRKTVGLGIINYYGWRHDTRSGEPVYQSYLAKLKQFVCWLLDRGYVIKLLTGDSIDQRPFDELLGFVQKEGHVDWHGRVFAEPIVDVDNLFQQILSTDIVVASRFHNVLCALMMGRPVVSIGYHKKNEALLAEMGLESYCQHIEHFSVDQLILQFQSLASEHSEITQRIQHKCAQYREMLDRQYQKILRPEMVRPPRN